MASLGSRQAALIERDEQLTRSVAALADAAAGSGALLVVEGAPGVGKTRLLEELQPVAEAEGMLVLTARGGELEAEFPFGIVRQLFERPVHGLDRKRSTSLRSGAAALAIELLEPTATGSLRAEPTVGLLHGVYWLAAELASARPLMLVVDDAHWADPVSLRALGHIARRLDGVPLLVVVGVRAGTARPGSPLAELVADPSAVHVDIAPLTSAGTRAFVSDLLGQELDEDAARACHTAAGGNPFLLSVLARTVEPDSGPLTADRVRRLELVAPRTLVRGLMLRLGLLPAPAIVVAQAVAVLGDQTTTDLVAELSAIEESVAVAAIESLVFAGVLADSKSLSFAHPLIRTAVYGEMSAAVRGDAHRRAAELLRARGAPSERIASLLLAALPVRDQQAVDELLDAGRRALERGAFDTAVRLLRRAQQEPPTTERAGEVLVALGGAELASGDREAAVADLRAGVQAPIAPDLRLKAALALVHLADAESALAVLDTAAELLSGESALRVEVERAALSAYFPQHRGGARARIREYASLSGATPAERLALGAAAGVVGVDPDGVAADAARLAHRAAGGGRLLAEQTADSVAALWVEITMIWAEAFEEAEAHGRAMVDEAQARGSPFGFGAGMSFRAWCRLLRGDVPGALGFADAALTVVREAEHSPVFAAGLVWVTQCAVIAHVERGELALAEGRLELTRPLSSVMPMSERWHAYATAYLALARGDHAAAWNGFQPSRSDSAVEEGVGDRSFRWRLAAARAAAALGRREEAIAIVERQLEVDSRWGAAGGLGETLVARALVGDPAVAPERLDEAVAVLRTSERRLELARALLELGVALRRAGRRLDARTPLEEGVAVAAGCGAARLAERGSDELAVLGARPQRLMFSGIEGLTASERRVVEMAAEGMSNRAIAQALFVTLKTVESHLSRAFRKLEVGSRDELAGALQGAVEPV